MSKDARSLISGLLQVDVSKRLGNIKGGAGAVKSHPWFKNIEWDSLYDRKQQGPIVPHLTGPTDTRNFDEYDDAPNNREKWTQEMETKYREAFKDF